MKWLITIMVVATIVFLVIVAINLEHKILVIWAVVATMSVGLAFIAGLVVGGLEARGKVSGIDVAADNFTRSWERIADATSKAERNRPQPTVQVYNAAPHDVLPPISHRQLPANDEDVVHLK